MFVAVSLSFVLYSADQRRAIADKRAAYGASAQPDAALIADFAACLKQKSPLLPFAAAECGAAVAEKHGPDSDYRVDAVFKTVTSR